MSTSAESASNWLRDTQPDDATVQEMVEKLNTRIEQSDESEDKLQGSIEALDVLEHHLNRQQGDTPAYPADTPELDTRPLIDHTGVAPERPADEKRAIFEQLKNQLK